MANAPRYCKECGEPHGTHSSNQRKRAKHAEFCSARCRKAWNNRRMTRGAVMYDLVMCLRHERKLGEQFKVIGKLWRYASDCLAEDQRDRDGRKSWRHIKDVLADRPSLSAIKGRI